VISSVETGDLAVALLACVESLFAIVTSKALCVSFVVRETDEPSFPRCKKLLSRPREIGVAIVTAGALRRMQLMIEDDRSLCAAAIPQRREPAPRFNRSRPKTEQ
jgi:hypothetical protein